MGLLGMTAIINKKTGRMERGKKEGQGEANRGLQKGNVRHFRLGFDFELAFS